MTWLIQYYSEDNFKDQGENGDSCLETKKFFLNCLALLLGRLDDKRLESLVSLSGQQICGALFSQVRFISVTFLYLSGMEYWVLWNYHSLFCDGILLVHLAVSNVLWLSSVPVSQYDGKSFNLSFEWRNNDALLGLKDRSKFRWIIVCSIEYEC